MKGLKSAADRHTILTACREKSEELGILVNIALVDEGANLLSFDRMPGAFLGSIDIAINKAKTAVRFQMTTATLGSVSRPDGPLYSIENACGGQTVLFGGGVPLYDEGQMIGGLGISGGSVEEDEAIAQAGLLAGQLKATKEE